MDETILSSNGEKGQEREFSAMKDLSPLEHILIGSSIQIVFNTDFLVKGKNPTEDAEFLLKPYGLTTQLVISIEEIRRVRADQKNMPKGMFVCFTVLDQALRRLVFSNYEFGFLLGLPDQNGLIANEFRFQFRKVIGENSVALDRLEGEDLEAFNNVELREGVYSSLFSLDKQPDVGILVLKYKKLLGNIKR